MGHAEVTALTLEATEAPTDEENAWISTKLFAAKPG
jgi:hypothetical protein